MRLSQTWLEMPVVNYTNVTVHATEMAAQSSDIWTPYRNVG